MRLSKVYEDAERRLERNEITLGEFERLVDIEVIEPKRGEWKPFDLKWGRSIWYCTACEESTEVPCDIWEHKPIYKYCPNCGADMRERKESE